MNIETREELQEELLDWMGEDDNLWTIWYGDDQAAAIQLLNIDDSNCYTRKVAVSPEIMAYDTNIKITTELYRITVVLDDSIEPDANAKWYLSKDNGVTKTQVIFVKKDQQCKGSYWHVYLKNN